MTRSTILDACRLIDEYGPDARRVALARGKDASTLAAIGLFTGPDSPALLLLLLMMALDILAPEVRVEPSHSGQGAVVTLPGREPVTILGRELAGRLYDAMTCDTPAHWQRVCRRAVAG